MFAVCQNAAAFRRRGRVPPRQETNSSNGEEKKMAGWDYQSCLFTDVCERLWAECVNVALQWLTLEM